MLVLNMRASVTYSGHNAKTLEEQVQYDNKTTCRVFSSTGFRIRIFLRIRIRIRILGVSGGGGKGKK